MTEISQNSPSPAPSTETAQRWWRRPWAARLFWLLMCIVLLTWIGRNTWEIRRTQREFSQRIAESTQRFYDTEKKVQDSGAVLTEAQKKNHAAGSALV